MADQSGSSNNLRKNPKIINSRSQDHLDKIKSIQDSDSPLNEWEEKFLDSISEVLLEDEELTDQQAFKLDEIYEKYS